MLETLISSKIRLKLLYKFFINPEIKSYLRGLESELSVSSNAVRQELNKLEEAGVLVSEADGNKKVYLANRNHPLFEDVRRLLMKSVGIEQILEKVVSRLGNLDKVYITDALARGVNSDVIDLFIVGDVDKEYLAKLIQKAEALIHKKIRYALFGTDEWNIDMIRNQDHVLIFDRGE